jgi:hypothetical protein
MNSHDEVGTSGQIIAEAKKLVTIYVNATPHEWPKGLISFEQVVTLEVPDFAQHPEFIYAVKYKKSDDDKKPEGILLPGKSVKVKEGTTFSVSKTGQS